MTRCDGGEQRARARWGRRGRGRGHGGAAGLEAERDRAEAPPASLQLEHRLGVVERVLDGVLVEVEAEAEVL